MSDNRKSKPNLSAIHANPVNQLNSTNLSTENLIYIPGSLCKWYNDCYWQCQCSTLPLSDISKSNEVLLCTFSLVW